MKTLRRSIRFIFMSPVIFLVTLACLFTLVFDLSGTWSGAWEMIRDFAWPPDSAFEED